MELTFQSGAEAIMHFGQRVLPNKFNMDDPVMRLIYKKAYLTFMGGRDCKEENISPNKGIWLVGDTGVGKSILMKTMQTMFKDSASRFKWVDKSKLENLLEDHKAWEIKEMYGKTLKCDLYIDNVDLDDLNWNNSTSIVAEILYERDELFVRDGFKTHLTTHLTKNKGSWQLFDKVTSPDILDRLRQMTNLITWEGGSLRK
jgi:AAA+ ATPase superfamily predicted ATPase